MAELDIDFETWSNREKQILEELKQMFMQEGKMKNEYTVVFEDDGVLEIKENGVVFFDGEPVDRIITKMTGLVPGCRQKVTFGFGYALKPASKTDVVPA